ncbi:DUF2842 domain-containing protein [Prosthecomicrobium pneumaticum]|uniref:ABC-type transporter Mla subunit MlaD n=1 Tax=Prosthecomicrobium pneumaticum TaxID=81895 RepID=A0A7W9FQ31_9HYPH|nr:DUF2842 domain-containing protein [Prosthecomicrobium pneumaticum]MBB5754783.1 ABC-type transporter Mla subunit MlaD [Prosthecomicrobium pneumaticum]
MPPRLRSLIGAIALVALVVVYAFLAMVVALLTLPGAPGWVQGAYYVIAGLLWVLPAGLIIRWILKPRA